MLADLRATVRALAVLSVLAAAGCASGAAGSSRLQPDHTTSLRGHDLTVHLASGGVHPAGPLLLYATGDGGWPGDEKLFDRMRPWGYPMGAISSADYVGLIDGPDRVVEPSFLATDFGAILDVAIRALDLAPETRVVLVGFSRGSGLAVAAATDARLRARLRGIVAIALTGEEEFVAEHPPGASAGVPPSVMLQTYQALPRLGPLRLAVIQSTRDEFLPAGEAQRRFGPETPVRRFRAIDAADHSFGGKLAELGAEMKAAVEWIVGA
jgi:pimeloyl-ACP methyl ester carboxylesterase